MGAVLSYDDKSATPSSEINLDSGEHVFMNLDKKGLVIKSFSGGKEHVLFKTTRIRQPRSARGCSTIAESQKRHRCKS